MKRIQATFMILGTILSLLGCGPALSASTGSAIGTQSYSSGVKEMGENDAQAKMEEMLKKKYQADFSVESVKESTRDNIFTDTCYVADAYGPEGVRFKVQLSKDGSSLYDGYAEVLFREEFEQKVASVFAGQSAVATKSVKTYFEPGDKKYDSLDACMKDHLCYISGEVSLDVTDEDLFAEQIVALSKTFEEEGITFAFSFSAGGKSVFIKNGPGTQAITLEWVKGLL